MMRRVWLVLLAVFFNGGLMLPAARGQSAELPSPAMTAATGFTQMFNMIDMQQCWLGCDPCAYGPFPGVVDYCLGLRKWKKGHYHGGLEYLKLAAGWGNKHAQYTLGLIYYNGHHVAANRALGIAWLKLADQRHDNPHFALIERSAMKAASPAQRQQAQRLLAHMRKRYGDKVAAERAWQRIRHWQISEEMESMVTPSPKTSCVLEGQGVVPWRPALASEPHAICLPSGKASKRFAKIMRVYFKGVRGTVKVGPLQATPAPSSSIDKP